MLRLINELLFGGHVSTRVGTPMMSTSQISQARLSPRDSMQPFASLKRIPRFASKSVISLSPPLFICEFFHLFLLFFLDEIGFFFTNYELLHKAGMMTVYFVDIKEASAGQIIFWSFSGVPHNQ